MKYLLHCFPSATEIIANRVIRPALYFDSIYTLTNYKERQRFLNNAKVMHKFTDRVIQERRQLLQDNLNQANKRETTVTHASNAGTVIQLFQKAF